MMGRLRIVFMFFFGFNVCANAQEATMLQYHELSDPKPIDKNSWNKVKAGTHVSFASTDIRYHENTPPTSLSNSTSWRGKAWKGEKVHTQFLIYTTLDLQNTSIEIGKLTHKNGQTILPENIRTNYVRHVLTDELPASGTGCGIPKGLDTFLVADILDTVSNLPVSANTTQAVWLSVEVPPNAIAGTYSGKLRIRNGKKVVGELNYAIEVLNRILPEPSEWKFHLDLWQNPFSVARMHNVKPWSQEHMEIMRPYIKMLADAGQKVITASIIHDPWNSQTLDVYGSMIRWVKKTDGSWNYDYTHFDQWVNFMHSMGIKKFINCYSMIPWNLKFYYYDESAARDTFIVSAPGTAEYAALWTPMLKDFVQHLKLKGWYETTTIAMDERPLEAMQKAIKVIRNADAGLKISLAGNSHPEIQRELFDYCVASNQTIDAATMLQRKKEGKTTTYYTCCAEAFPNTFTFSPPAESTWLAWHAANKGFDGYLRWAYNSWPKNPLADSRYGSWSGGDTYLVYPGLRSSIRFERLIEGIQDFEKIRLLKEEYKESNQTQKLQALESTLSRFEIENLKSSSAAEMLHKSKSLLNQP